MTQNALTESIKSLYPCPISDAEAQESASNLLSFMELLLEIDMEHGVTPKLPWKVCGGFIFRPPDRLGLT